MDFHKPPENVNTPITKRMMMMMMREKTSKNTQKSSTTINYGDDQQEDQGSDDNMGCTSTTQDDELLTMGRTSNDTLTTTNNTTEDKKQKRFNTGGPGRRVASGGGGGERGGIISCQAEKCAADLTDAKRYHRRHKVCEFHAKAPSVLVSGLRQRFCQQCSRFHELSEFDETKRSCRRRLAGHNERRRKSSSETQGEGGSSSNQAKGPNPQFRPSGDHERANRTQITYAANGTATYKQFQIR